MLISNSISRDQLIQIISSILIGGKDSRTYLRDKNWLFSNESQEGAFLNVCDQLNIDSMLLRNSVREIIEGRVLRPSNTEVLLQDRD